MTPAAGPSARTRRGAPLAVVPVAVALLVVALAPVSGAAAQEEARWTEARERMVEEHIRSPSGPVPPVEDEAVLRAMAAVPRHEFVPDELRGRAYENRPLPIGEGQTISQPWIVARMTELLELEPGEKVLEVGTGSGYQAAVLAEITDSVYSIEILEELARSARERLRRLGYGTVRVRHGDGYLGWPEHAPFDAVVVTAAPDHVPPPLVEQLAPGGRMVIPRGPEGRVQVLTLVRKEADGTVVREELTPVRFVPLRRAEPAEPGDSSGSSGGRSGLR